MDCGRYFTKYLLFVFNMLFVFCGIGLIAFGSIMVSRMGHIENISEASYINSVPIEILVMGCIIFFTAFLGCCVAVRENACCTMTYAVIMFILFVCQLALIIFVWTKRAEFLQQVDIVVQKIWDQRHIDQKAMDTMQLSLNCCGKNDYNDYVTASEKIPSSCCTFPSGSTCSSFFASTNPGCSQALSTFWNKNIDIIRFAGIVLAALELMAFIFAFYLAINKEESIKSLRLNYDLEVLNQAVIKPENSL